MNIQAAAKLEQGSSAVPSSMLCPNQPFLTLKIHHVGLIPFDSGQPCCVGCITLYPCTMMLSNTSGTVWATKMVYAANPTIQRTGGLASKAAFGQFVAKCLHVLASANSSQHNRHSTWEFVKFANDSSNRAKLTPLWSAYARICSPELTVFGATYGRTPLCELALVQM